MVQADWHVTQRAVRKHPSQRKESLAKCCQAPCTLPIKAGQGIDHDAGVSIADTPVVPQWPAFAAKSEAFDKPLRSHVIRMDQSFDSMDVECAGTIVEDRPHGLCPEAASLVLRRNDVAQLKASVVGVSAVIVDHANASTA